MVTIDLVRTSERWIERASREIEPLLLDHAHCEKKAAATALGFVFRCPERPDLAAAMSRLAREELLHFERLLMELRGRNITFRRFPPSAYAGKLVDFARRPRNQQKRLMPQIADELIIAGMIEARSTERFRRLAAAQVGEELQTFFAELAEAEARHECVYLDLAFTFERALRVERRMKELAEFEAGILENPNDELRLHSG